MLLRAFVAASVALAPTVPVVPQMIPTTDCYAGMPPARFAHPPEKPMRVSYAHLERCGTPNIPGHPNAFFASCIRGGVTYLPDPCAYGNSETFARLACHEMAHVNGWPRDHGA